MATAKQKAWRKKFARLYGKKRKAKKKTSSRPAKTRRVKPMARRRRRASTRPRRGRKYISISLLNIGHMAMQYSNVTGKPLGAILDQLTQAIMNNQGDVLDILMTEILSAVNNVVENPFQVAARAALLGMFFQAVRSFAGHRKILTVGKFRITV
jgi:hypothetical protein